jgi:hypothetical protein
VERSLPGSAYQVDAVPLEVEGLTSNVPGRAKEIWGSGGSLEPPGPLLTHLHTVYMAYSERLPTRLNPLAEGTCCPQAPRRTPPPASKGSASEPRRDHHHQGGGGAPRGGAIIIAGAPPPPSPRGVPPPPRWRRGCPEVPSRRRGNISPRSSPAATGSAAPSLTADVESFDPAGPLSPGRGSHSDTTLSISLAILYKNKIYRGASE